ncbi:uncharacterized protein LOC131255091 [Magnolia sinica]|uniref:uncharacterized protein LOC131255091 n=1 Tax=Magnolia sinica TaxID=86752 RepID=UPI0026593A10|nr:uncharacterized protein LOC131255091 [Magnolia sinica]
MRPTRPVEPVAPVPSVAPVPPPIPPPQPGVPVSEAPAPPTAPVPPPETHQPATAEVSGQSDLSRVSAIAREFREHDPPRFSGDSDPSAAEAWRTEALVYEEDWVMTQRLREQSSGGDRKMRAPAGSSRPGIGSVSALSPFSSRGHCSYPLLVLLSSSRELSFHPSLLGVLLSSRGRQTDLLSSRSTNRDSSSRSTSRGDQYVSQPNRHRLRNSVFQVASPTNSGPLLFCAAGAMPGPAVIDQ